MLHEKAGLPLRTVGHLGECERIGPVRLPCTVGNRVDDFRFDFYSFPTGQYTVMSCGDLDEMPTKRPLVRISSMCMWAHLFGSQHCDCDEQLQIAKEKISAEGSGLIVFCHDHHGKAVGRRNHFLIYAEGQLRGHELVVDAYEELGFKEDHRDYGDVGAILEHFGIRRCRLLTNSPSRVSAVELLGIDVSRESIEASVSKYNCAELDVKKQRLGHLLKEA